MLDIRRPLVLGTISVPVAFSYCRRVRKAIRQITQKPMVALIKPKPNATLHFRGLNHYSKFRNDSSNGTSGYDLDTKHADNTSTHGHDSHTRPADNTSAPGQDVNMRSMHKNHTFTSDNSSMSPQDAQGKAYNTTSPSARHSHASKNDTHDPNVDNDGSKDASGTNTTRDSGSTKRKASNTTWNSELQDAIHQHYPRLYRRDGSSDPGDPEQVVFQKYQQMQTRNGQSLVTGQSQDSSSDSSDDTTSASSYSNSSSGSDVSWDSSLDASLNVNTNSSSDSSDNASSGDSTGGWDTDS